MTIYVDAVFALNFTIDLFLLFGTNRICGYPLGCMRSIAAAIIGAFYATVCMLPGFRFLGNILWRTVSLCIICAIAFGISINSIRRASIFVFLNMAMGGIVAGFEAKGIVSVLLALGCVFLLCLVGFQHKPGSVCFLPVELQYQTNNIKLTALCDTGNTLRDPVSGQSVLIVDATVANKLTGLTEAQLRDPVSAIACNVIPGLRLIPFRTVGQSDGMLLALRLPRVKIGRRTENTLVAFSPEQLSGDGTYQALTGGMS